MNNAEVLIKFKGDTASVDEATKKTEDNFKELQKKGELAFAGITAAADTFAYSILKGGVQYNAQIETYLTRLTTLTGSAEKANAILDQIKKDALSTPFEVSSLTQAESLLLSTGLSAEDARKDILALGDAISASGGGNEELARMSVNLQQIKNVGRASALDIKQFAYAGIDIYGLLADSLGVSREEASKMTITYDMLSNALQNASQKGGKYYGAMEKQSKTYAGSMSNLTEAIDVFKGEMAKGLFNILKKIIPKLSDFFTWLSKNKTVIMAIAIPLLTFINAFAGFIAVQKATTILKGLFLLMKAHPIGLVISAIAALVAMFIYLWNNCEGFRNFWIGLWNGIKNVFKVVVDFLVQQINDFVNFFKTIFVDIPVWIYNTVIAPVGNFFAGMWNGLKTGAQAAWNGIKSVFSTVASFFKNIFTNAWNGVKKVFSTGGKIFTGIKDGIVSTFKTIVNGIIGGINKVVKIPFDGINAVLSKIKNISIAGAKPFKGLIHTIKVPKIPKLNVGTNFVPNDTLAMIHKGEAVIPKKFNPYANPSNSMLGTMNNSRGKQVINVYASFKQDNLGQMVRDIKTFSGGARNDFNYGTGV